MISYPMGLLPRGLDTSLMIERFLNQTLIVGSVVYFLFDSDWSICVSPVSVLTSSQILACDAIGC